MVSLRIPDLYPKKIIGSIIRTSHGCADLNEVFTK